MATFEAPSYDPKMHEHQTSPVPSAPEGAMALDTSINGTVVNHNSIPAFPTSSPPPDLSGSHQTAPSQDPEAIAPIPAEVAPAEEQPQLPTDLQSGITPIAPFIQEATTTDSSIPTEPFSSAPASIAYITQDQTVTVSQPDVQSGSSTGPTEEQGIPLRSEAEQAKSTYMGSVESFQPQESVLAPLSTNAPAQVSTDPAQEAPIAAPQETISEIKPDLEAMDEEMPDVIPLSKIAREREDDDEEEPSAKRTKTGSEDLAGEPESHSSPIVPTTETADNETSVISVISPDASVPAPTPAAASTFVPTATQPHPVVTSQPASVEEWGPLKDVQTRQLKQNLQNLKKGRHSQLFAKPVDHVALNIPTYLDIVKTPMDLGTMDKKLREGQYGSVANFVDDFNLIVNNCVTFNGPSHPISLTASNLNAQFQVGLRKVPKAGEGAPPEQPKKRRSSLGPIPMPQRDAKTRESRVSLGAPQTPNGPSQTFALPQDGNPLIRRTSTGLDGRPKREIHRPAPRDLPYSSAKPKKKKYQFELKFCEVVLGELKKGRFAHLMAPFSAPVDAVALNIPSYHKVIKKPMDFGTITEKLSTGQYENAREFEIDARLVFENASKFNGNNHPITKVASELESHFNTEWSHKSSWIANNVPSSAPQSPEAESDSEEEEEEEEDDDKLNEERIATINNIHAQIAELSQQAMALSSAPMPKKTVKNNKKGLSKGGKSGGGSSKEKRKPAAAPPRHEVKKVSKPKPPKVLKALTVKEKEEISERIGELSGDETAKAAELIKAGLRKSGRSELADKPDDELEFDIDSIPNDVLHQLLNFVRRGDATPDYRPISHAKGVPNGAVTKKKAKPMSKDVQEASIGRLQGQLAQFEGQRGYGANESSPDPKEDASDDDDDSGSESEEE